MKSIKTILVSILMVVVFLCSACSGTVVAVSDCVKNQDGDTPIAKIDNDTYNSYGDKSTLKEENETEQKEIFEQSENREIKFTLQVLDKLTNEPVSNAIVRLNGVPRFTTKDGTVKVTLVEDVYELFIEKLGSKDKEIYNPYIEFLYTEDMSDEESKTVYLKRPSDDIEITSVIFEYQTERYNLLTQPCYVLKNEIDTYIALQIECNVNATGYMLLVNGETVRLSMDNTIEMIELENYDSSDKFTVQVYYSGIFSKEIPIELYVDEFDAVSIKSAIMQSFAAEEQAKQNSFDIGNEEAGTGTAGTINFDWLELADVLCEMILPKNSTFDILGFDVSVQFLVKPREGTIKFMLGVSKTVFDKDWIVNRRESGITNQEKRDRYQAWKKLNTQQQEEELIRLQNNLKECDEKILEAQKNMLDTDNSEDVKTLIIAKQAIQDDIKNMYNEANNSIDWDEKWALLGDVVQSWDAYNNFDKEIKGQYEADYQKIQNAQQSQKHSYNSLVDLALKGMNLKQKFKTLKTIFSNLKNLDTTKKIGIDVDLGLIGTLVYSYKTKTITKGELTGEFLVKPSYTYQRVVMLGPVPVPFFVRIGLEVGLKVDFIRHTFNEPFAPTSFVEFIRNISVAFVIGLRVDGGVGIYGLAAAGVYGKGNFEFQFRPDKSGIFKWGAGVRIQFLFFEEEWGYDSDEIHLYGKEKASVMSRMNAPRRAIAESQLFDEIYQCSVPNLIPLSNGRQMLTWIEDDKSKDDFNRTSLMYSVMENGEWSEPQSVATNGKPVFAYDVAEKNGNVYLAYQTTNRLLTNNDTAESVLACSEIYTAQFDSKTSAFVNITQVTDNSTMDAEPRFAESRSQDDLVLTWKGNTNNDYFGFSGENRIYGKNITDEQSQIEIVHMSNNISYGYTAAYDGTDLILAISEDADGDLATDDRVLNVVRNGNSSIITGYNPNFIVQNNEIVLLYINEDNIFVSSDYKSGTMLFASTEALTDYRVSNVNGTPVVFYEKVCNDVEQVYCAKYKDGKWTKDILVSREKGTDNNVSLSTGYAVGDKVCTAYNLTDSDGNTVLCYAEKELKTQFNMNAYLPDGFIADKATELRVMLNNTGDTDIERLRVIVCGQVLETECEPVLQVSEERYFGVNFTAKGNAPQITVKVQAIDKNGNVLYENECEIQVHFADLDVSFSSEICDGKQRFGVNINNAGYIATGATVYVYLNGELYSQERVFMDIGKKETKTYMFEEINEGDWVYIAVVADEDEEKLSDNYTTMFSVQTERKSIKNSNPYADLMQIAKAL